MGVEENIKVGHERDEAFNAGDWDRAMGLYAESVVIHAPGLQEPVKGRKAAKEWMWSFFSAFPDMKMEVTNSFGQGDWIVLEEELKGTHTATLVNSDGTEVPPTNKPVQFWTADVLKVENGQITEQHAYFDILGMMAQLGLMPENE